MWSRADEAESRGVRRMGGGWMRGRRANERRADEGVGG